MKFVEKNISTLIADHPNRLLNIRDVVYLKGAPGWTNEKYRLNSNYPTKYPTFLQTILAAYNCHLKTSKDDLFTINQNVVANLLMLNRKTVNCYFKMAIDNGYLEIVCKKHATGLSRYKSNFYNVNKDKIEEDLANCSIQKLPDSAINDIINLYHSSKTLSYANYKARKKLKELNIEYLRLNKSYDTSLAKGYKTKAKKVKQNIRRVVKQYSKTILTKIEEYELKRAERAAEYRSQYGKVLDILNDIDFYGLNYSYLNEDRLRLSSDICYTKNHEHHPEDDTRLRLLEDKFDCDRSEIRYCDVNSSIYRLEYNLNHDELLGHTDDLYETVFKASGICEANGDPIKFTKDIRSLIKNRFMPLYMANKRIGFISYSFKKTNTLILNNKDIYSKVAKRCYDSYYELYKEFGDRAIKQRDNEGIMRTYSFSNNISNILNRLSCTMKAVLLGDTNKDFYSSEIFIHESNIHIMMLKKFQSMGWKAINCYDGFYFKLPKDTILSEEELQSIFYKIYDETVLEYKHHFITC